MTTHLEREINEQPEVAARLLDRLLTQLADLRGHLTSRGAEGVYLVARGSSDNAARYAQYLWPVRARVTVTLATPSLATVYDVPPDLRHQAVVAVSQSGRSPDVVAVVEQAREAGRPTLAVTNDPASPLAEAAEVVVDLAAGRERSVAATKTYTGSLLALAVLGVALQDGGTGADDLRRVPDALAEAISGTSGTDEAAQALARADRAVAVGRGLNLATAHETALKVTELTGTLVAPDEPATASVLEALPELERRGAPVVVLGRDGPALPDWLTPLAAIVPGQLLAWRVAEMRGVDVDNPGDLSKVTLTR